VNHSITLGDLLLGLLLIAGLGGIAFGALMVFAAGMSDAGDDGTSKQGCVTALFGIVACGASLALLFH
jgi:hypothetical protein